MLSKATVKARPSVLWCYKKELGFSSHRKKRMRQLQKKIKSGTLNIKDDDPFELFIAATNIRYCYYNETHKILGNTFGMCVLQDFEALTPNLLARTVETVEGGGIVVILLRTMNSLKQLYTMTMDVHSRYRTEAHQDVVGRFNERFILSLASCKTCLYIHPADSVKLGQAELVVIDEAAAIPLPLVKNLLGPYLVFMASTINGSLCPGSQVRGHRAVAVPEAHPAAPPAERPEPARTLHEVSLHESIRYAPGDPVEKWLNDLLCLDCLNITRIISGCPLPDTCDLYYVNRDTLFCYHRASEVFLQRLMALYVASHYKVCMEGEISRQSIMNSLSRGKKASGDLIPWTISEQFQDPDFGGLSGGRVVRIAVHPDYQGMGYGSRALTLLQMYYEGKFPCLEEETVQKPKEITTVSSETVGLLEEVVTPRKDLPPLLLKLSERQAEHLDYLGVSYGLTPRLLKFWKRAGFVPVYLRQTPNDLTGEHSCIMLKMLNEEDSEQEHWLTAFWKDFRRRFLSLLSYQFSTFSPSLALNILQNKNIKQQPQAREYPDWDSSLSRAELESAFIPYDLKRLEMYSRNMVDYHLIMDMVPTIARMFFLSQMGDISLSAAQSALFLGIGLQHKSLDQLEKELELPSSQLMGLFNRIIRKVVQLFNTVQEKAVEEQMAATKDVVMEPTLKSLNDDLEEAAKEFQEKHKQEVMKLKEMDLTQYIIRGDDEEWNEVLSKAGQNASVVSLKSEKKRKLETARGPKQKKFKKTKDLKQKRKK
ncbi:hypothetical protein EK904_012519 [Melospiza melodia maxima]|nr:hypothetical protein EK904_012519 [Melospiza melodia maxima]